MKCDIWYSSLVLKGEYADQHCGVLTSLFSDTFAIRGDGRWDGADRGVRIMILDPPPVRRRLGLGVCIPDRALALVRQGRGQSACQEGRD